MCRASIADMGRIMSRASFEVEDYEVCHTCFESVLLSNGVTRSQESAMSKPRVQGQPGLDQGLVRSA